MRRDDGNSYTSMEEAIDRVNSDVDFARHIGISAQGFVQQRGINNYLVTPVEYRSFKTVYATANRG